jgi:Na+-driven multidrug efflux pump
MASTGPGPDRGAEKREQGTAISFIGLAFLVANLLVVFFAPAAFRLGHRAVFAALIVILAVIGVTLVILGRSRRKSYS